MSMNSTQDATYEGNLRNLGYVDFAVPSGIAIYPKDFESKEYVVDILDNYNSRMEAAGKDEQVITYTDVVGTLMSSVTDIIDIISYVLHQLRADCFCCHLSGGIFDYDWRYYLHQCAGEEEGNRYSPGYRCF